MKRIVSAFSVCAVLVYSLQLLRGTEATPTYSVPLSGKAPTASASCEPELYIEWRSMEGYRKKVGFDEFTNFSTPPKKYLQQETTTVAPSVTYTKYGPTDASGPGGKTLAITKYYQVPGTTVLSLECSWVDSGGVWAHFYNNGTDIFGAFDFTNAPGVYTSGSAGPELHTMDAGPTPQYAGIDAYTASSNSLNYTAIVAYTPTNHSGARIEEYPLTYPYGSYSVTTNGSYLDPRYLNRSEIVSRSVYREFLDSVNHNNYEAATRTYTRKKEYTTELLLKNTLEAARSCVPAWGLGTSNMPNTGCISESPKQMSYRVLKSDEMEATLGQADFHFSIPGSVRGTRYSITWSNMNVTATGQTNIWREGPEVIHGIGGMVYGVTHSLPIPSENGTNFLIGARVIREPEIAFTEGHGTPGCSSCAANGDSPNFRALIGVASVEAMFNLGGADGGAAAGMLYISERTNSLSLATPSVLRFQGDTNRIPVVFDSNGVIQSVSAPQVFVSVDVASAYRYAISYFSRTNGGYQTTPFVTYTIENPNGTTNINTLLVTESRNGLSITNRYDYLGTGVWQLSSGNALMTTRVSEVADTNALTRKITREILNPDSSAATKTEYLYKTFGWGEELVSVRVDPEGANLLTTNTFNSSGQLQQTVRPDGGWDIFVYDVQGRLATNFSAFTNQGPTTTASLCRMTVSDYAALTSYGDYAANRSTSPRIETTYVLGLPVSRRFHVYPSTYEHREYVATNSATLSPNGLVTTNVFVSAGSFQNEISSITRPDGSRDAYLYGINGQGEKTVTHLSGQAGSNGSNPTTNVVSGTQTVTVHGGGGQVLSSVVKDIINNSVVLANDIFEYDEQLRLTNTTHLDQTSERASYLDCCNAGTTVDRDGTVTTNVYDTLRRLVSSTRAGVTTSNFYDPAGRVTKVTRSAGTQSVIEARSSYDPAGRVSAETNAVGSVTLYSYTAGNGLATTVTQLTNDTSGVTRATLTARDGSVMSVTGSATHPVRFLYGVDTDGAYVTEIKLDVSNGTNEWTKTSTDFAGNQSKLVQAAASAPFPTRTFTYNGKGQLAKETDPDGVTTRYQYDAKGELEYTALVTNGTASGIDFANDRVQRTATYVTNSTGSTNGNVVRTIRSVWLNGGEQEIGRVERSVDGLHTWESAYGRTSRSDLNIVGNGQRYITNRAPDGTLTISYFVDGRIQRVSVTNAALGLLRRTSFGYDGLGRRTQVTDARNGTTEYTYDNSDRVLSVTTPEPGSGGPRQTTTYQYDVLGRVTTVIQPDGTAAYSDYHDTGEPKSSWGSRTYPVVYGYDAQGRMTTMTTWQDAGNNLGAATTTWRYSGYTGLLTNKVYATTNGPSYSYTSAGRLAQRKWARGVTTTYTNNVFGDVQGIGYSDGTTNVVFNYDQMGRRTNIVDAAGRHGIVYDLSGRVLVETNSSGTLAGTAVGSLYDPFLLRTQLSFTIGANQTAYSYAYDPASRLTNVAHGNISAAYTYVPNSPLVQDVIFRNNGVEKMRTTKSYDRLSRLTRINNQPSAASATSFRYDYNEANQRVRAEQQDGSYWNYGYDSLGQVTSGKKYWNDQTPVAGQQFEYAFDDIGNRKSTKAGGDANGDNLRSATYTPNLLNQYTSRTVPGTGDVLGLANANASVTVNSQATSRKGEYYAGIVNVNNSTGAVYQSVTTAATLSRTTVSTNGNLFFPQTAENFSYDADGNLKSDGRWNYTWDAENRLVGMDTISNIPTGALRRLSFQYDYVGRRVLKGTETWSGAAWVTTLSNHFLYSGLTLVAEVNATNNSVIAHYAWGLDLSKTISGASGVGGLLMSIVTSQSTNAIAFDGQANVRQLVDMVTGSIGGDYEYGPFGETVRTTGASAVNNTFGFSTKYTDVESGLIVYPTRCYHASSGRWLSRDRIGERGGINLSGFVANNPVSYADPYGRSGLSLLFGHGWDGDEANEFESSLGDSMIAQWNEMVSGAKAISCGSAWWQMHRDFNDHYDALAKEYGYAQTLIIGVDDLLGITGIEQGISGYNIHDLDPDGEKMDSIDRWSDGLAGAGQLILIMAPAPKCLPKCAPKNSQLPRLRTHRQLIKDFTEQPDNWYRTSHQSGVTPSGKNKGGFNTEAQWRNKVTGEELSTHEAWRSDGTSIHPENKSPHLPDGGAIRPRNQAKELQ